MHWQKLADGHAAAVIDDRILVGKVTRLGAFPASSAEHLNAYCAWAKILHGH